MGIIKRSLKNNAIRSLVVAILSTILLSLIIRASFIYLPGIFVASFLSNLSIDLHRLYHYKKNKISRLMGREEPDSNSEENMTV
jgi:hypothetical protein